MILFRVAVSSTQALVSGIEVPATPVPPVLYEIHAGRERVRLVDGGVSVYTLCEKNSVIDWDVCMLFVLCY
jgi:hypothetical protein